MKLNKKITDEILTLTNSTPEELLNWFGSIYVFHKKEDHPCKSSPYLGIYKIAMTDQDEKSILYDNRIVLIKRRLFMKDLCSFWRWVRRNDNNYIKFVNYYCKMYKL